MIFYPKKTRYGHHFGIYQRNPNAINYAYAYFAYFIFKILITLIAHIDNSTNDRQLFETSPLLVWLPDESLFSLVSRIHYLSGHRLARQTSDSLFGNSMSGTYHDFPSCLREFELRTKQCLGTAQEIASNKTLLKYYRAFIPISDSASIIQTMNGSSVAHLKFKLGLITSRFRANHPLKACPACMADDRNQYGWAYWHLDHQFPGVWWCDLHNQPLYESLIKSTGVGRFLWHLPNHEELRRYPDTGIDYTKETTNSIISLTKTTLSLVEIGNTTPWNTEHFWITYRKELANRGWLRGQSLRFSEITSDFLIYSAKLRLLPELTTLPTTIDAAKTQLGRLLRSPRCGTHPLRHIILVDWLFGGADSFLDACNNSRTNNDQKSLQDSTLHESDGVHQDPHEEQAINLLREKGISMRAAAKEVGVDIYVVMAWAAKAGIPILRRPKILSETKRDSLITKLRQGIEKANLASQFGVSVVTINRTLRTVPGLQREWQTARFDLALSKARTTWCSLIDNYPHLGTKLLRSLEPAVYAWLYRNDRDWLRDHSPRADPPFNNVNHSTMWDKRDIVLSTEVKRTALYLVHTNPQTPLRLWQLYQQIPELKAKLKVLDRLPLTKRAIEQALNHPATSLDFDNSLF